jgi:hypothetical protein
MSTPPYIPYSAEEFQLICKTPVWEQFWDQWYKGGFGQDTRKWSVGPQVTIQITDNLDALHIRDLNIFYQYRRSISGNALW